jgi:hypothetical protein
VKGGTNRTWQQRASLLLVQHQLRFLKKELNDLNTTTDTTTRRSIPTNHLVHYYLCPKLLDALSFKRLRGKSASAGVPITAASQLIDLWMPIIPELNEIWIEKARTIANIETNGCLTKLHSATVTIHERTPKYPNNTDTRSMIILVPRLLSHISLKQLTLAHRTLYYHIYDDLLV